MSETETTKEAVEEVSAPESPSKEMKVTLSMPSDWSWGGLMFAPAYLIAVKKYKYLLLYLLGLIPVINVIAMIGIPIFVGMKGHGFVAESDMFKNDDERAGFNRAMDHAGWIMFLVAIATFILAFLFAGLIVGVLSMVFGGPHMFR